MIDTHVHTARCRHAEGEAAEYVAAAVKRGVTILGFSDHLPLPETFDSGYAMPREELPSYVADVLAAREQAAASGGPEVLLGVESDWLPDHLDHVRELTEAFEFDFVVGSVHFLDGWAFDDPALRHRYDEWDPDELWARYFAELERAATSGLYDVMAHPDLVKKFCYAPTTDPREIYEAAAHAMAHSGVAAEVSTAGLRKPCREVYPAPRFLKALREAGVPVTVGSDAHAPSEVGYAWDRALGALRHAGYDSVLVFRGRVPSEVSLP